MDLQAITLDGIPNPHPDAANISLSVLRLDKIHPVISGNKWFKLKYYLEDALLQNKKTIATFGGAYSNHIIATAAAAKLSNLKSIGIIRGEEPKALSQTLIEAQKLGMQLLFIGREQYRAKMLPPSLNENKDDIYLIHEGGYGPKGAAGASSISSLFPTEKYTHICCAVGTGTMISGLINSALPSQKIIGISVLKNNLSIHNEVQNLLKNDATEKDYYISHEYHFGGYAKANTTLFHFMNEFYEKTNIPTDFVYTGKLFYAISDLIQKGYFKDGSNILIIHSGGLQGNHSLANGTLIF